MHIRELSFATNTGWKLVTDNYLLTLKTDGDFHWPKKKRAGGGRGFLQEQQRIVIWGKHALAKTIGKFRKHRRGTLLCREKGESWGGMI